MTAVAVVTVSIAPTRGSAEGFLDFLFSGFRPPQPPPSEPTAQPTNLTVSLFSGPPRQESLHSGTSNQVYAAYCVRLCDGRYFPIEYHNASAVEQCRSVCPAARTKVFSGSGIDRAVATDGTHYAELHNAYIYRKRIVHDCTCNGTTNGGLVHMPIADDPTLRPGDIIATNSGLTVYKGRDRNREANFTPIGSAKVSRRLRAQLANVKVVPNQARTTAETIGQASSQTVSSISSELRSVSTSTR